jgi:hypothetical protein
MAKRKAFLMRVDPAVLDALQKWADDDLRSLNGQIEYVLRQALGRAGRRVKAAAADGFEASGKEDSESEKHPGSDQRRHPGK